MCTYHDVRFKYPWRLDGGLPKDHVNFSELTGFRHFCVGIHPDKTFSYLKIYDEHGGTRFESELSHITFPGLVSLIQWRLSTSATMLSSMAMACLGFDSPAAASRTPQQVRRFSVDDARFTLPVSRLSAANLTDAACVMLIASSPQKCEKPAAQDRHVVLFTVADEALNGVLPQRPLFTA